MNKTYLICLAGLVMAAPALADVKQGVDAWSRGDYRTAVDTWRPLAAAGDADAQFNLGQAYKLGRGVPVDLPVAIEWFRKAAAQGHMQAIDNYGLALFQDGKKSEALPWLEKSAARDEKRTQLVLGTMLFNGDGMPKDWVRAYALVTRSSQQGLPQASQTLAQMDQYIPEAQRQQGLTLARKYETDARALAATMPPPPTDRAVGAAAPVPTKSVTRPTPGSGPGAGYSVPGRPASDDRATPAPAKVAAAKPVPTPRPVPATRPPATPKPASGGAWRIQLGAFRDEGNARSLWSKVGGRTGGSASYAKAGAVTRLQATGFASKAAAQAACRKSGVSCVVVAP
ncbi:sporulation protein [Sphingomonas sp. NBWT7]|uniref:SPOR domain-containing protein n=1 Tax=Sphingomonas sp. NBWT7 TaxID=2596913 RepID=UPI001626B0A0|nr:SPOR domain-containing protein [Sphingomonas sp. NBWT7]QNE31426.1 sporulation protein [Sphingomonas sp. NBWT7]